jgi:uncharacterized protein with PIN domain
MERIKQNAWFRFYEELNDFLPPDKRKTLFLYSFNGSPPVKDAIEAIGVPHTEVDLILADGQSVDFSYRLQHGAKISVYPVFESLDISPIIRLRPSALRNPKFILDVHLGKLARLLRLLGFDTVYQNDFSDEDIIRQALDENRIILTQDRGILKHECVTHGYCVRSRQSDKQIREVLKRFDLFSKIQAFKRCLICNGEVKSAEKSQVMDRLPPRTKRVFNDFFLCESCGKVYWKGSHYERMEKKIESLKAPGEMR